MKIIKAKIYIISDFGTVTLPITPENMPKISQSAENEEFASYDYGIFNIPVRPGLKTFEINVLLPLKNYSFLKNNNSKSIIDILKKSMKNKKPIRVIMIGTHKENILCLCENLSYFENQQGNIEMHAGFKEFRYYE